MRPMSLKKVEAMQTRSIVVALSCIWALVFVDSTAAHPLGNFSINQYSALRVGRDAIMLRYIVDMAEIPTFQELEESGIAVMVDDPNVEAYLTKKVETLHDGLWLEVNGRRLLLRTESQEIIFPPGAAGLPTLKIGISFKAKLPADVAGPDNSIIYRDGNFTGRAGWKEIIAVSEPAVRLVNSSVPQTDRSAALTDYPTDLLNSPPQQREARVEFALTGVAESLVIGKRIAVDRRFDNPVTVTGAGGERMIKRPRNSLVSDHVGESRDQPLTENAKHMALAQGTNQAGDSDPLQLQINKQGTPRDSFTELISTDQLGWSLIFIAFAFAVGLGAFHALEPGHGKTLVAAYLVGSRGTMRHALLLGLIVTAAHTAGVYLLGGVTLYASQYIVPERLYPWLGIVSGVMITILGAVLVMQRYRGKGVVHSHHRHGGGRHFHHHAHGHTQHHESAHSHERHAHYFHHDHEHANHGHSSSPEDFRHEAPHDTSARELLTLGISGGIVPCPAGLVVLLSAVSMNRVGFGLLLIVAFSAGLAAVLIAIGILMVNARQYMARFQGAGKWAKHWLPVASSALIVVIGVGLTWQACLSAGITLLAWI